MTSWVNDALTVRSLVVLLAGTVLFIWGCVNYCQGKGQPGALGLLGLLSLIGLLVLVLLPDKHKGIREDSAKTS
jgi:hypothetical protein